MSETQDIQNNPKLYLNVESYTNHLYFIKDETSEWLASANVRVYENNAFLYQVYTYPGFRRKGYATELMNQIIQHFGDKKITLELEPYQVYSDSKEGELPSIKTLLRFYKKFGFVRDRDYARLYYRNPQPIS